MRERALLLASVLLTARVASAQTPDDVASARSIAADGIVAFRNDCEDERRELLPRVPRIVVRVEGADAAEVTYSVDGDPVPPAFLRGGCLVDPGTHEVVGVLGTEEVRTDTTLGEGDAISVVLAFVEKPADYLPGVPGDSGSAPSGGGCRCERGAPSDIRHCSDAVRGRNAPAASGSGGAGAGGYGSGRVRLPFPRRVRGTHFRAAGFATNAGATRHASAGADWRDSRWRDWCGLALLELLRRSTNIHD